MDVSAPEIDTDDTGVNEEVSDYVNSQRKGANHDSTTSTYSNRDVEHHEVQYIEESDFHILQTVSLVQNHSTFLWFASFANIDHYLGKYYLNSKFANHTIVSLGWRALLTLETVLGIV